MSSCSVNAASAINSSPVVVYPQVIADNELSDRMLTRLTLPVDICSAKSVQRSATKQKLSEICNAAAAHFRLGTGSGRITTG